MSRGQGEGPRAVHQQPDALERLAGTRPGKGVLEQVVDQIGKEEQEDGQKADEERIPQRASGRIPVPAQDGGERKEERGQGQEEAAVGQERHEDIEERIRHASVHEEEQRAVCCCQDIGHAKRYRIGPRLSKGQENRCIAEAKRV